MTYRPFQMLFKELAIYNYATVLFLVFVSLFSGCHREKHEIGTSAIKFQREIQSTLDRFSSELVDEVARANKKNIQSTIDLIYSGFAKQKDNAFFFVSVLDAHGVTIATKSQKKLSGIQNYGNYHAVSRVLQKRRPLQSTLYLPECRKIYIICSPLIQENKIAGVLIIGMDSDYLKELKISENDFMRLTFSARTRTP